MLYAMILYCIYMICTWWIVENKRGKKRGEAKEGTGKEATEGGGEAEAERRGEKKAKGGWKAKEALWKGDKDQGMT